MKNVLMAHFKFLTKCQGVRYFSRSIVNKKYFVVKDREDFVKNVMNSNLPVIVNFHAEWCDPCHTLTSKLIEMVKDSEDIILAEVDIEKHAELVHTFEVKAVPAVLGIKNGIVVDKFIGVADKATINKLIENLQLNPSHSQS